MSRIYAVYHIADAECAGRLYERLSAYFGPDRVFMNLSRSEHGGDRAEDVEQAIRSCAVLLALIGRQWLVDANGRRHLDDPRDRVRMAITACLSLNVAVL